MKPRILVRVKRYSLLTVRCFEIPTVHTQARYPTKKQNPNQELAPSNQPQTLKPVFCYVKI